MFTVFQTSTQEFQWKLIVLASSVTQESMWKFKISRVTVWWDRDNNFSSLDTTLTRDVDPAWKLGGTSGDIKELPETAKKASCPFSSLKSHPSGICRGDSASRFPSLEETSAGKARGKRESESMPSYPLYLQPPSCVAVPLPPPLPIVLSRCAGFAQISPFIFLRRSRKSLRCLLRARYGGNT